MNPIATTFHLAIFTARRTFPAIIGDAVARQIESNLELQRTLGLNGTPAWMIGDRIFAGAVGYDELKKAIAEAREK